MTHTLGQKLKQAREAKRLTLEQVFESIRIRVPYLKALEEDDFSAMPSPVQARGYLRNYADFLGLNVDQLLEELRAEKKTSDEIIGPADLNEQAISNPPEPVFVKPAAPLSTPEAEPVVQIKSQPDDLPPQEEFPVIKPKTTRRKKAETQTDSGLTIPKRRGRKKADTQLEPELTSIPEPQPEIAAEPIHPIEHEPVAEPIVVTETVEPQLRPESEAPAQPDVNETLWQAWLNRLGSVFSIRKSQREEAPSEDVVKPIEPAELEFRQPANIPTDQKESSQIFKEIGAELRTRRELLSLNLVEVENNTHVKAHYLEALEHGEMENLPSTVQTRGMLSNYAAFLDLDVDAILLRYADALQARHREKNPRKPARKTGQPILANLTSLTNFIAGDMVFGVGVAVLMIGFLIWAVSYVITLQSERDIEPTAPSISDVLLASPEASQVTATATFEEIQIPGQPTVTIVIPTLNANVNVQVNLVAVERTYMRVIVDGKVRFDGRVLPGNAYPFEGEDQVEVLIGNGAAIRMVYNGQDLGLMGAFGQVVSNIYRSDEIITPTAFPTTVPTNTLTPTATTPPTRTPVPTNTPVPSNTPKP